MNKPVVLLLAALVFSVSTAAVMPTAQAAVWDEWSSDVAGQAKLAAEVQEALAIKKNFEAGNQRAAWSGVVKQVLQHTGKGEIVDLAQNPQLAGMARTALKQKIAQRLTDTLAPYQKQLAVVAALLNLRQNNSDPLEHDGFLPAPVSYKRVLDMTATAYAPGSLDNGKWGDKTYMGGTVRRGVAAVDPRVIPMGSRLWVEGYGEAVAEDQGSAITGNRIDLAFPNRREALDYGIQQRKIYLL